MDLKKFNLFLYFSIIILSCFAIGSLLHNIDLSFNIKNTENIIDCNLIKCDNIENIYIKSYFFLWFLFPIFGIINFLFGFYFKELIKK